MAFRREARPEWPLDRKVYVGGLPDRVSRTEIEAAFSRFGTIENVWVARQPPGFAFVLFEDERDARDATKRLDGSFVAGVRARVEMSHGLRRNRDSARYRSGGTGRHQDDREDRRGGRGRSRSRSPRGRRRSLSRSNTRSRSRSPSVRSRSITPSARRSRSPR